MKGFNTGDGYMGMVDGGERPMPIISENRIWINKDT